MSFEIKLLFKIRFVIELMGFISNKLLFKKTIVIRSVDLTWKKQLQLDMDLTLKMT
jgi:hypothetical protein